MDPNGTRRHEYPSAHDARVAVCARMSDRAIWRRLRRKSWSRTSKDAAIQVLQARAIFAQWVARCNDLYRAPVIRVEPIKATIA